MFRCRYRFPWLSFLSTLCLVPVLCVSSLFFCSVLVLYCVVLCVLGTLLIRTGFLFSGCLMMKKFMMKRRVRVSSSSSRHSSSMLCLLYLCLLYVNYYTILVVVCALPQTEFPYLHQVLPHLALLHTSLTVPPMCLPKLQTITLLTPSHTPSGSLQLKPSLIYPPATAATFIAMNDDYERCVSVNNIINT